MSEPAPHAGDHDRPRAGPPLAGRLGILQGRLVPSATGLLQCAPGPRWEEELRLAGRLGLAHIELLAERVPEPANVVWSPEGRRALGLAAADSGVGVRSLCLDEPLEVPFAGAEVAAEVAGRLVPVVDDLGLTVVVVPLFEASELLDGTWGPAAEAVRELAGRLGRRGARVALELSLPAGEALGFLDLVASPSVGICHDTGNAVALGLRPETEIALLGARLWHLHAKDKDGGGTNVEFGRGLVDFGAVVAALGAVGFSGLVTMEATRGDDPPATAAAHRRLLLALAADPPAPGRTDDP